MSTKVQKIKVQNLKAVASLEIDFHGCTGIITGSNNKGKSSFLRSLPDRLRGLKPDIILKHHESEGFAEWTLTSGEKLIWSFDNKTKAGERLVYVTTDKAGNEIKTSISKEIALRLFPASFDVDAFLNSTPQKQTKVLQELVGLDFTHIDARHKTAYDERTFSNKKRDEAKVKLKPINKGLKTVEDDTTSVQQEIAGIELHNHKYQTASDKVVTYKKQLTAQETEIKRLETLLKTAKQEHAAITKSIASGEEWLSTDSNKPKGDEEHFQLNKKLQDIIDNNLVIKNNNEAIQQEKDYNQLVIEAKEADQEVKKIEQERLKMIRDSNMPVCFGFDENGDITYNDLPFTKQQLSSSGIYIAALKLAAMNIGEVKTLHFDASTLDRASLTEIEAWAKKQDLQLLIERPSFEASEIQYELIEDIK